MHDGIVIGVLQKQPYLCGFGAHLGGGITGAPGHNATRVMLAGRRPRRRAA